MTLSIRRINFNPRSPDGERQLRHYADALADKISIHAPRMGSDWRDMAGHIAQSLFQSTLPGWGATRIRPVGCDRSEQISIHAPRMGSDPTAKMDIFAHDMGKIIHFQH